MAKRRRKARVAAPRKRRRRSTVRRNALVNPRRRRRATTRRRSAVRVAKRRRSTRRSVRRNPSVGGAINLVTRGIKDAAYMVGGEMASNVVASYIPAFLTTTAADGTKTESDTGKAARKVIAAVVVGYIAQMVFRGGDAARLAVAGALAAPLKQFVRPMLPTTGKFTAATLLSAYPTGLRLNAYPTPMLTAGMGAYGNRQAPRRQGIGCDSGQADSAGGYGAAYFGG